jgi:hypothetical protein
MSGLRMACAGPGIGIAATDSEWNSFALLATIVGTGAPDQTCLDLQRRTRLAKGWLRTHMPAPVLPYFGGSANPLAHQLWSKVICPQTLRTGA